MNFYKILNKEEKHHDLQYQTGLNIDPIPFDPSGSCKSGGIYFSREDIFTFLGHGPWIRKVTIPEDAQVYKNPGEPKKWKADRVILGEREKINDVNVIKRLIEEGANPKVLNSFAFRWAAERGYINIVKLLLPISDPTAENSYALQWAAKNKHLEIVKLLLEAGADPKAEDSCALLWAAGEGHLEIVKLLLEAGADPKAGNSHAVRWAARCDQIEIVKLLLPVSYITKYCLQYINKYCNNQEILDLVNNYKKG
jgi:ankyrin repeat protein